MEKKEGLLKRLKNVEDISKKTIGKAIKTNQKLHRCCKQKNIKKLEF